MFAPEKYTPLSVLMSDFIRVIHPYAIELAKDFIGEDGLGGIIPERRLEVFYILSPHDVAESETIIRASKFLRLCSPTGQILKFDLWTLLECFSMELLSINSHYFENSRQDSTWGIPDDVFEAYNLFDVPPADFLRQYKESLTEGRGGEGQNDFWTFAVEKLKHRSFHQLPQWFERPGYTITLETWRLFGEQDSRTSSLARHIAKRLAALEGYSMCLPDDKIDAVKDRLREKGPEEALAIRGPGRTPIINDVVQAVRKLHPHDFEDINRKVLLQNVQNELGRSVSRTTLYDALALLRNRSEK
ncbi:hypothetical protein PXK58_03245 [Phaeobacter gallaeciensis]|uniref:hypothetical protein n=1 Tax=Phaeobacter gallaeciensis TaxID=60890 RepID=UPI00238051E6|nr:hypothetical protein [Phaeobacter gallaeciensis]MDE4273316.1 hypothetical protein [Phaeobacter gallaeciensis]MDE4298556.1 hypothetical protein [Phaeobacter gallaeciensis]MDE5184233.1 hypothetical protein [Phaeobacter gallaeciensis]